MALCTSICKIKSGGENMLCVFGVQVMTIIAMLADEVPQVVLPKALMAMAAE